MVENAIYIYTRIEYVEWTHVMQNKKLYKENE